MAEAFPAHDVNLQQGALSPLVIRHAKKICPKPPPRIRTPFRIWASWANLLSTTVGGSTSPAPAHGSSTAGEVLPYRLPAGRPGSTEAQYSYRRVRGSGNPDLWQFGSRPPARLEATDNYRLQIKHTTTTQVGTAT